MKVNSINGNLNFTAISTRAANEMMKRYKKELVVIPMKNFNTLLKQQAENSTYHVDFQNGKFVVCTLDYKQYDEGEESVKIINYNPVKDSASYDSIYAAAYQADLYERQNPSNNSNNSILCYTV